MDVNIVPAGLQVGSLRICKISRAGYRALGLVWDRHGDTGVLAGLGRPVEMCPVAGPLRPE
jgi:hypothetical protein